MNPSWSVLNGRIDRDRAKRSSGQQTRIQMVVSLPLTEEAVPSRTDVAVSEVEIPQYRRRAVVTVWAAAALPMAALAWLVAPALKDRFAAMATCLKGFKIPVRLTPRLDGTRG
jgi:hypothetical protein